MTAEIEDYVAFMKTQHLNADISYRCPLQCSMCTRAVLQQKGTKKNEALKKKIKNSTDISSDNFIKLARFTNTLLLCGHISDPVHHPHFLELLKEFAQLNKLDKAISIHTAANQRNLEWYEQAFELSKKIKKIRWTFGLDGLPELNDSMIYRVGQNSTLMWQAMLLGKKMGIDIRWNFIVFRYNEDNIDKAKAIAKEHDIKISIILSNRKSSNEQLKPSEMYLTKDVKKSL